MRKIKILRIIARLNIGGPAIHTILLSSGIDRTRFESFLVCGSIGKSEGDMSYLAQEYNVEPIVIRQLCRSLNICYDLIAFWKLFLLIIRTKPDIIHTHTAKAGTLGRLAAIAYNLVTGYGLFVPNKRKIILIHTFHGHIFDGYFNKVKTKMFIFIERFLAFFTDKIVTISASLKESITALSIGNKDKIAVIPLGFELDRFLNILPKKDPISTIGIIGRLVPIKNHYLFLDVASKIIASTASTHLKFEIIGDGELRNALEKYAHTLNIDAHTDFLGWQKELVNVYSDLDMVILTSINEGTPVSLIEAMASGRTVIATNVGGVKDLLGNRREHSYKGVLRFSILERGIIVPPGDSDAFVSAISFISKNNDLKRSIEISARKFVAKMYRKERLFGDIERLYTHLLNGNTVA